MELASHPAEDKLFFFFLTWVIPFILHFPFSYLYSFLQTALASQYQGSPPVVNPDLLCPQKHHLK